MAHGHAHHHHHHHQHHHHPHDEGGEGEPARGPGPSAFSLSISLNVALVVAEIAAGVWANSLALVADAAHNLTDVLGLVLAWAAARLALKRPSSRRTYGLRRTTILAALANALLLMLAVGGVGWEAARRLRDPGPVQGVVMLTVAAVGAVVNGLSAAAFARGRERDANVRAAFMHLAGDAAVSVGVVVAGAIVALTGARWVDPAASIAVSAAILVGTWTLLRESLDLALDAVPGHIDPERVLAYLNGLAGVEGVHDLHIWAMSTTEVALTAHLVMSDGACHPAFLRDVGEQLRSRFGIDHSTLQVESPRAPDPCALAPDEVL